MTAAAGDALSQVLCKWRPEASCGESGAANLAAFRPTIGALFAPAHSFLRLLHGSHD